MPGVYGRSADFEAVRLGVDALVTRETAGDDAEQLRFPPLLPRRQLRRTATWTPSCTWRGPSSPFDGDERQALELHDRAGKHEEWSEHLDQTDLMVTPAACYPVYPAIALRGPLPQGGVTVDIRPGFVFRREPSTDPTRLQMFHMREVVRIAEPDVVIAWRDGWRDRTVALLRSIGLDADLEVASDPFFGRGGQLMARSQRQQEFKFEIVVAVAAPGLTAIASSNYHQDHLTATNRIGMQDGSLPHSACLAFGLERVTLALLATHGLDSAPGRRA